MASSIAATLGYLDLSDSSDSSDGEDVATKNDYEGEAGPAVTEQGAEGDVTDNSDADAHDSPVLREVLAGITVARQASGPRLISASGGYHFGVHFDSGTFVGKVEFGNCILINVAFKGCMVNDMSLHNVFLKDVVFDGCMMNEYIRMNTALSGHTFKNLDWEGVVKGIDDPIPAQVGDHFLMKVLSAQDAHANWNTRTDTSPVAPTASASSTRNHNPPSAPINLIDPDVARDAAAWDILHPPMGGSDYLRRGNGTPADQARNRVIAEQKADAYRAEIAREEAALRHATAVRSAAVASRSTHDATASLSTHGARPSRPNHAAVASPSAQAGGPVQDPTVATSSRIPRPSTPINFSDDDDDDDLRFTDTDAEDGYGGVRLDSRDEEVTTSPLRSISGNQRRLPETLSSMSSNEDPGKLLGQQARTPLYPHFVRAKGKGKENAFGL